MSGKRIEINEDDSICAHDTMPAKAESRSRMSKVGGDRTRGGPPSRHHLPQSSRRHLRRSLDVTELILTKCTSLASAANFHANSSGRAFRSKISGVAPSQYYPLPLPHFLLSFSPSSRLFFVHQLWLLRPSRLLPETSLRTRRFVLVNFSAKN